MDKVWVVEYMDDSMENFEFDRVFASEESVMNYIATQQRVHTGNIYFRHGEEEVQ